MSKESLIGAGVCGGLAAIALGLCAGPENLNNLGRTVSGNVAFRTHVPTQNANLPIHKTIGESIWDLKNRNLPQESNIDSHRYDGLILPETEKTRTAGSTYSASEQAYQTAKDNYEKIRTEIQKALMPRR